MATESAPATPQLLRRLGTRDAVLLTVGSVIGTGIFITTGDMAKVLPSPGMILAVWVVGGLLTLAGALTYAEMGAMYPRAGGLYHFLKEAYGPLWGFLYGWAAFTVIMSGGIAALAAGFGEYLGSFLPFFANTHALFTLPLGGWAWTVSGGQLAAVLAILALTAINHLGVREGAWTQSLLTVLKIGAIVVFGVLGLLAPAQSSEPLWPASGGGGGGLLAAFGVGMIAALWTYDGWYGVTFSAGEMKNPSRALPLGLIAGTLLILALYVLLNLAYFRALPVAGMAATPRVGEAAAEALFGLTGGRLLAAAVVLSTFGCLSSTILYSSRIYLPMAEDGVFFRSVARIDPRFHTPVRSLWAQSAWAIALALTGTYAQLYTYVVFASVLFQAALGAAVIVLRRRRPELARPYRTWGYPWVPVLFILASLLLVGNTLVERPVESLLGLALLAVGLPLYAFWRRRSRQALTT